MKDQVDEKILDRSMTVRDDGSMEESTETIPKTFAKRNTSCVSIPRRGRDLSFSLLPQQTYGFGAIFMYRIWAKALITWLRELLHHRLKSCSFLVGSVPILPISPRKPSKGSSVNHCC